MSANFDRVRGFVLVESRGRLSADEQDEATQRALIRIANNLFVTFRGQSMGEWVMAVRRLVKFACIDVQRRAARISSHELSLEAKQSGDDDDRARWDHDVFAALADQRRENASANEDADVLASRKTFLDWALPQLSPKRRAVVELDRDGVSVEEMQDRLGISRDVVYASRSRAIKDLAALRRRYEE